ncbi:hypothetical protein [Deinococcus alpinitundrae]|uniref:hypothetical protein n=1 Tax=Deinococcus alpinitundrae TaxID=468913 RepID=UPI00192A4445|nr:hypothetical protein [Deinococcus alpinitundrae]
MVMLYRVVINPLPAPGAMIERGTLQPQRLIGRRIGLEDAPDALVEMDRFLDTGVTVVDRFGRS